MKKQELTLRANVVALLICSIFAGTAIFAQDPAQKKDEQDPQEPTIKIGTSLVTVPVIVTDRYGRFITGLPRRNFTVLEDGVEQNIEEFSSIEAPFSVALLLDTSRSTENKLGTIRKAALTFIKQLQPRDSVMIVTFDDRVRFLSDFTNNMDEIERSIKKLKSGYLTSLYDAINVTITEKLEEVKGRKAIVILTDGVDTASKKADFESTLDLIASAGIICYTVQYETRNDGRPIMKPMLIPNGSSGFTDGAVRWQDVKQQQEKTGQEPEKKEPGKPIINIPRPGTNVIENPSGTGKRPHSATVPSTRVNSQPAKPLRDRYLIAADFLRAVAVQSGARYIRAENIENTSYAFRLIAEELRNQYTLTYISYNEERDGSYRSIAVSVKPEDLLVRARLGYRAPQN